MTSNILAIYKNSCVFTISDIAIFRLAFLTIGFSSIISFSAHGFQLGNCSDDPKHVTITYIGNSKDIVLQPWQKKNFVGYPAKLTFKNQQIMVNNHDDMYCIWDSGITIQRSKMLRGRR